MKRFVRNAEGRTIDPDSQLRCSVRGPITPLEEQQSYLTQHGFYMGSRLLVSMSGYRPIRTKDPIRDGVRIKMVEIGRLLGPRDFGQLTNVINSRNRVRFDGTNFEYVQYLASGIGADESESRPFRVIVFAQEENLRRANVSIPSDAERLQNNSIVLFDSNDECVRV